MDNTVRISYYPILATKTGDREFTFKGKPNLPNLVISDAGTETTSYIAMKLRIGDNEIAIDHEPTTNYHRKMTVRFDGISIMELDELQFGESKEIAVNTYLPFGANEPEPVFRRTSNGDGDEVFFPATHPSTSIANYPVIEGACSSKKDKATDKAMSDLQKQYNDLADTLNSLKGTGTVNTTYQYMDPEGDMSCQLMEDSDGKDVNVFRQNLYEDKTIKDYAKSNKKLSDATTALSIGMFGTVAFILMGILLACVYYYAKMKERVLNQSPIQMLAPTYIGRTFIVLFILGILLASISGGTYVAGLGIMTTTVLFVVMLCFIIQPAWSDVFSFLPQILYDKIFL